jgi:hypothetical protein
MNSQYSVDTSRRRFLAGVTVAGGALSVPLASAMPGTTGNLVVLYDQRLADRTAFAHFETRGVRCLALAGDPVRLWRGDAAQLLGSRDTRLMGVTRWADLLIIRGLAAESGRRLQSEKLDRATGMFTWMIA